MEEPQKVAIEPVTRARGDGVKTKNGCENLILGQNPSSRGVVSNHFSENSSDLGHYFLPSSPEKRPITHCLEARDAGYDVGEAEGGCGSCIVTVLCTTWYVEPVGRGTHTDDFRSG